MSNRSEPTQDFSRREALRLGGGFLAGAAASVVRPRFAKGETFDQSAADSKGPVLRRRTLRLAHLTDIHVQPERGADRGLTQCLHHVQSLEDPPELILNGGDGVIDVFSARRERADQLLALWQRIWKDECSLRVRHCVGNHDIWGLDEQRSQTTGNEDKWGLSWALSMYGIGTAHYSFDQGGWHFIVLNSMSIDLKLREYDASLGAEQLAWLEADLARTNPATPVLVLSHIPILSAAVFFLHDFVKSGHWELPGTLIHLDAGPIKEIFKLHSNVKLCLSGHLHLVDHVRYLGVSYICDGAVSGAWWAGNMQEFEEGYGLIDLYDDGTFEHQYVAYNWTPPADAP